MTRSRRGPSTSLVIATYNWKRALELVLESVLRQRRLPEQVLIADDGSSDGTDAMLRAMAPRFAAAGVELVHLWQADDGFRKTRALNRAIAAARGDYVLMVDGDCILHREFVRSHLAFSRPHAFVFGSRVLLMEERTREILRTGTVEIPLWTSGLKNRQNGVHFPLLGRLVRAPADPLKGTRGCNVAFWKRDAIAVNGFNEAFVGWGREDSEFGARLIFAGVARRKIKFAGVVFHLWHRENSRHAVEQQHRMYEEVVARRVKWAEVGLDRHLTPRADVVEPTDRAEVLTERTAAPGADTSAAAPFPALRAAAGHD